MVAQAGGMSAGRMAIYLIVLVVAGATALWVRTRFSIDEEAESRPEAAEAAWQRRAPSSSELAAALAEVHRRGLAGEGMSPLSPEQLSDTTARWIGTRKEMADLLPNAPDTRLIRGAPVDVPGPGPAAALVVEPSADSRAVLVLKKYLAAPPLDEEVAYRLNPPRASGLEPIVVWRRPGLVLYLLADSPATLDRLRHAVGAHAPSRTFPG